jgi:Ni/Fe-hydrogenase 1 B-type cytochrome subunit
MKFDRVSGRVLAGPLEPVYVYEAPVRFWHWTMMICLFVLAATGYLIGSPPPAIGGEATFSYYFATIRMVHFIAAMLFAVLFLVRIVWAFVGNHSARAIFVPPVWSGEWWRGLWSQALYYLFLRRESELWVGHNPLAQLAMFFMFVLGSAVIILTGFALFAEQYGWGSSWMNAFGWVNVLLGGSQMVRTIHNLAMWYLLLFAIVHMYMVFREDIMSGESVVGTMVNGIRLFKGEPRGR